MKFQFSNLRWVFLGLYLAFLIFMVVFTLMVDPRDGPITLLFLAPLVLGTQFLMASSTSAINFCGNFKKKRILVPAIIGGLAFMILTFGFLIGTAELLELEGNPAIIIFWVLVLISWLFWTLIFYFRLRGTDPDSATGKLVKWTLLGSITELVVLVPMHVVTSSRGHCFAGMQTGIGLIAGVSIALWSFGPGIILLFIRHYRKHAGKDLPQ